MTCRIIVFFAGLAMLAAFGEAPFAFRERLCSPHEAGRRDTALKPKTDEFALADGAVISVPSEPLAVRAAEDFRDYCRVSMGVDVRVERRDGTKPAKPKGGIVALLDGKLPPRSSRIKVVKDAVGIAASDPRALMQAFFHLEDLMNLRRAPYLGIGVENRRQKFSPRMAWSGLGGAEPFPDGHLAVLAHAGFDAFLNPLKGVDQILAGKEKTDVNDVIDRAAAWGLDAYFLSHIKALKHPDDPGSAAELARTYGAVAKKHPRIRGFVLVPECNYFESRDPRVSSKDSKTDANGRPKPAPSRFPCSDYPQWLKGVEATLRAEIPNVDFVFWTYNFHWAPEADRFALIDGLEPSTILNVTFALGNWREHRTRIGLCSPVDDYSISTPGPSQLFRAEAARAHRRGLRLFTTCNTGGRTWDFGSCPYEPVPFQWKRRYDALERARTDWGLEGLIETWQYGFMPNFIAELTKESFVEGGLPFDDHVRRIAARDFGEAQADEVLAVWKDFSEAICDYTAMGVNQYGPFRIGPAYPYNALGPFLKFRGEWPGFTSWLCNPNYGWSIPWSGGDPKRLGLNLKHLVPEIRLFREAGAKFLAGAEKLRECARRAPAERRAAALREAGVGEYVGRAFLTAANVKDGVVAERAALDEAASADEREAARKKVYAVAREEYGNTLAALGLVRGDSRLGWIDGSSQYGGGVERIEWKLRHMEKLYGIDPGQGPVAPALSGPVEPAREETADAPADVPGFLSSEEATTEAIKKNWKLVFEDEFEGAAGEDFDHAKWHVPGYRRHREEYARLDGKGHLAIKCDYNPGCASTASTNLDSTAVWSNAKWKYGYFEARVRFTRNNGWWAAFWLFGESNANPVECGSEIDVFEDYFTRYPGRREKLGERIPLDHNLHAYYGPTIKSVSHESQAPGSIDDFHTIGCKWTPFEIAIYFDGKLLRRKSGADAVKFDAFRDFAFAAPLNVVLSGGPMRTWGPRDTTGFVFPEYYLVDSVRVWEYPGQDDPAVDFRVRPAGGFVPDGETLKFEAGVEAKAKLRGVYLFDNGAFVAAKTEAPWVFEVPFSKAAYEGSAFMRPGRQKKAPEWEGLMHSFTLYAQDELGRVGESAERVRIIPRPTGVSTPAGGAARKLPGRLDVSRFDDGGDKVAYRAFRGRPNVRGGSLQMLHTGEWLRYTVDVAEPGVTSAVVGYTPCFRVESGVELVLDGKTVATAKCPPHPSGKGGPRKSAAVSCRIPAGRHELTLVPIGYLTLNGVEFN